MILNILTDSEEQNAGFSYAKNERIIGNIKVVAGKYYLISFSLKTSTQRMPNMMGIFQESGLTVSPIINQIINTSTALNPAYPALTNVYKSIGTYLYGGLCTQNNDNWSLSIVFGQCAFSSFSYSIDEVQGSTSIIQSISTSTNIGSLSAIIPGNSTYMVGMSMIQNESFPITIANNWSKLSNCHDESVVPNLITGWSSIGDINPGWTNGNGFTLYPTLENALIACELSHV